MKEIRSWVSSWPLWLKKVLRRLGTSLVFLLIIALIVAVIGGYFWKWDWTGLNRSIGPVVKTNQQYRPEKTLWDWLQLLVIPFVLAIGVFLLNQFQKSREENATKQQTEREARINFLRRVRAAETTIMTARELLSAHDSAKTYSEQFAQLRLVGTEMREVVADLKAWEQSKGSPLFCAHDDICIKLAGDNERRGGIAGYLDQGAEEYRKYHNEVIHDPRADPDPKKKPADRKDEPWGLFEVVKEKDKEGKEKMPWTKDFMDINNTTSSYQQKCINELSVVKEKMRPAVYRA
ncbi:MAG TPA: hypothetical protein VFV38_24515 [Ktedonobacteraceae bacterium]|nr:hypothetical protein [Ktedonobacteraceae bacterium]